MQVLSATGLGGLWALELDQSIGIDETNTFQLTFFFLGWKLCATQLWAVCGH